MPGVSDLLRLLAHANETLASEYKSWLPLADNEGKAKLAKAAIALANHGGGIIVLGMTPDKANGGLLRSEQRPADLPRYNQDDINAAINRFADPAFHCELAFARHPETDHEHAFVIVPSGQTVPVMSKRDCQNIIHSQRCYVRKPGPKSEEALTGEEWRALLERCIKAGRENMLDAIRLIVHGYGGTVQSTSAHSVLSEFSDVARQRWQKLIEPLTADDPARFPYGYREIAMQVLNVPPAASLSELKKRMEEADGVRLTGWHPFVHLSREPYAPHALDGAIEAWLGAPDDSRPFRGPSECDFWRVTRNGQMFALRGYDEDETDRVPPGTAFDACLPVWRVGEPLLYAARLAKSFGENSSIAARIRFTGLRNRYLTSVDRRRMFHSGRVCHEDAVEIELQADTSEIIDNLAEVLHPALVPLFERFDFFELPMTLVAEELASMRRNRF